MIFSAHPLLDRTIVRLMGPEVLELLANPTVQEISANCEDGRMRLFVDYGRGNMREVVTGLSPRSMVTIGRMLATASKQHMDRRAPFLSLVMHNGFRMHMAYGSVTDGPSFSIRMHPRILRPLSDFVSGTAERRMREAIAAGLTILVAGGTNSGKTTLLNSLINLIPADVRLLVIEDAAGELQVRPGNVVRRFATPAADLRRQVFESLRDRPDRIIVGEIRGSEARDLLEAAVVGHSGTLSTIHANDCAGALARLQRLAACDQALVREALDLVVFVKRMADGRRMVTEIQEVK